ncbi:MAG: glycoside hydrolase domain-containing protein, partial [Verrucomicrobiota bacterium]
IYLDGQKKVDEYQPMLMPDFENEKSRICIGSYNNGAITLNGLIDDFMIHDGPVYTQESYPELFIYPPVGRLQERLSKTEQGAELIPASGKKQEAKGKLALLKARIDQLDSGEVGGEVYFKEYALIDDELHRLWETSAAPALWWADREAKDFEVLPVSCMRKVSDRWSNAPSEPELPELASCGHEWSAFQLVVFPRFKDVENCTVKMDALAGEDGEIAASNLKIFKVGTVMQEGDSKNAWADPIFPLEGPFTVPAETIQALWIQIYVPEGTAPGEYKGRIAVSTGDRTEEIPVSVWVRDFTLPVKPRLQTAFGFAMSPAATYYRNEDYRPIAKKYLENMLEHKVSIKTLWLHGIYHDTLFLAPKIIKTRTGEWKMDFADYDRQLDELLPLGLNTIMVGYRSWDGNFRSVKDKSKAVRHFPYYDESDIHRAKKLELPVLSPKTEKFGKWVIKTWYKHLKVRGLENMAYTYFVDEPNHQMMGMINTICGWSHDVAPDLGNMITAAPSASTPNVDIWCPLTVNSNVLNYERSGGTIWKYVCCGPLGPSPNFFINQSALENRLPLWEGYKAGAKGFLYYEIGRSLYFENDGDNVWPLRWQNSTGTEGDGFFVYPGEDGPINTIRFEYIRMGIQDVEYFLMLKDLLKNLPAEHPLRAQAEALLVVDDSLMEGFGANYNTDWQIFERRKHHVGQMIELLEKAQ